MGEVRVESDFRTVQEHAITLLCHDADDERDAAGLGVAPTAPLEVAFRVVVVRAST